MGPRLNLPRIATWLFIAFVGPLCLMSCKQRQTIEPPFLEKKSIAYFLEDQFARRSGLTGDGIEIKAWKIAGDKITIVNMISPLEITDRLVWLKPSDERFIEAFAFLNKLDEFRRVLPEIQIMFEDLDTRIAFEDMFSSERGIEGCSLWICSPQRMRIVYVSAK
jgi:hypothetical protein